MSGLVGFAKKFPIDRSKDLLNHMVRSLEPERERYDLASYSNEYVGLGRIELSSSSSKSQFAWNQSRTICASLIGEIYNFNELKDELVSHGCQFIPENNSELVLYLFEIFDNSFAVKINGAFVATLWNQENRQLTIINDRLGLYPIYYAHTLNGLIFSTGVRALFADLDLDRSIDLRSIAQFLTFDHLLNDQTLLSSVRVLPQASILTFLKNELHISTYWRFQYPKYFQHRSLDDYLDELNYHLRNAIKRQAPNDISAGLLLSGGLDLRFLLALHLEMNSESPLNTFTWGIPGCDDARIARELARKTGTQHHFFELKPDYLLYKADEAVRLTDGMANIINLHALATLEEEAQHAKIIYKGFLGDAMMGFALQRPFWADYDNDTAESVHLSVHDFQGVYYYDRAEQKKIFTDDFHKKVGNSVFDTYRKGMLKGRS